MKTAFPFPKRVRRTGFCPNCGAEMKNLRGNRLAGCSRDIFCTYLVEGITRAERNRYRIKRYGLAITTGSRRGGRLLYRLEKHGVGMFMRDAVGETLAVRVTRMRHHILDRFKAVEIET